MRTLRNEVRWLLGLSLAALVAGCNDRLDAFGGNNTPVPGNMPGTPGNTVALTSTGRIISFDRASPTITQAFNVTGLRSGEVLVGVDIRPGGMTSGQLYGLSNQGRLYTIDATTGIPQHDPDSLQTSIEGLFIAGVVVAGYDANKVFIENGRFHGDKIVAHLLGKPVPAPPRLSAELDT